MSLAGPMRRSILLSTPAAFQNGLPAQVQKHTVQHDCPLVGGNIHHDLPSDEVQYIPRSYWMLYKKCGRMTSVADLLPTDGYSSVMSQAITLPSSGRASANPRVTKPVQTQHSRPRYDTEYLHFSCKLLVNRPAAKDLPLKGPYVPV